MAAAVRHKETWKTAEILILRHQLAVLQRRQPRRPKLQRYTQRRLEKMGVDVRLNTAAIGMATTASP